MANSSQNFSNITTLFPNGNENTTSYINIFTFDDGELTYTYALVAAVIYIVNAAIAIPIDLLVISFVSML